MNISIDESGVTFGPFAQTDFLEFEKVLKEITFGDNVCKAEFIARGVSENASIFIVEAKSSLPHDSDKFFAEIRQKMIHTLTVWFAAVCGRHESVKALLPEKLKRFDALTLPIKLFLVIPTVPDQYLQTLSAKFRKVLISEQKIWAIGYSDINVLNESRAIKYGLIARNNEV
jgi:hypothetical protein